MTRKLCFIAFVAVLIVAARASAQDVYRLNYFSNNIHVPYDGTFGLAVGVPDATVRIDNPGLTYGNLCAMIYVFDADQQLSECCGCVQTHNNLTTTPLSFLTTNPLTGVISTNGVIKIVSAAVNNSPCDPTSNVKPTPNLREWGTHVQSPVGGTFPVTETEFSDSTLGATELANLQAQCAFVNILGSGHGICTCGGEGVTVLAASKIN
jgi:hypothetical protein